jgi:hypothetical protein
MNKLEKAIRLIATITVGAVMAWITALWVADYWEDYSYYRDYSAWNHAANIAMAAIFAIIGAVVTYGAWDALSDHYPDE